MVVIVVKDNRPLKFAVAVVIRSIDRKMLFVVQRPPDDDEFPDMWGLPSASAKRGELPEEVVRRIGREKLNVELTPNWFLGVKYAERTNYKLILMDMCADIAEGALNVRIANVRNRAVPGTKYVDWRWVEGLDILKEAASRGSICSQILLEYEGVDYPDKRHFN
ncbi:MAG: hypothetical protein G01um101429_72 [Parcubacteria group bacterium Gr01-1014_29]|nr:MAG: hypothetical protein G01um101429_72 [Parcubacteria group bacterium Gr01-1014_29]